MCAAWMKLRHAGACQRDHRARPSLAGASAERPQQGIRRARIVLGPPSPAVVDSGEHGRLVSWNLAGRNLLGNLDGLAADVALLQEARLPGPGSALQVVPADLTTWRTAGWGTREWRTAVIRLSDRVELDPRPDVAIEAMTGETDWVVSRHGTVTAADVKIDGRTTFTAVSVYAPWEKTAKGVIFADGSAHRILSDLSGLMPYPDHRLLIAGDWNILLGYGEHGDSYYKDRYATVFARAEALGLRFVGP